MCIRDSHRDRFDNATPDYDRQRTYQNSSAGNPYNQRFYERHDDSGSKSYKQNAAARRLAYQNCHAQTVE